MVLGAYKLSQPFLEAGLFFYNKEYADTKDRLKKLYGGGEKARWAIVTGASEGIGREFAI